jgi:hypothetical protein
MEPLGRRGRPRPKSMANSDITRTEVIGGDLIPLASAGIWFIVLPADRLDGVLAQLVERLVRNEKVRGSNPLGSTILL